MLISCDDLPAVIYPAALHARRQRLFRKLSISGFKGAASAPNIRVALRLRGLIDQPWPLSLDEVSTPTVLTYLPPNPAIKILRDTLNHNAEIATVLEILVDGNRVWGQEVKLMPPCAVPTAIESAELLAVFVIPYDPVVSDLAQATREQLSGPLKEMGFPGLSANDAVALLYSQIHKRVQHFYAWEPAPWKVEVDSQVLRLPHRIISEREATCADMALLIASVFERVRRLPVLVGLKVDAGVWHLIPGVHRNTDAIGDQMLSLDLNWIRETCRADKIILLDPEATLRSPDFEKADTLARQKLASAQKGFLLDIQAAREADIWPLPIADHSYPITLAPAVLQEAYTVEYPSDIPRQLVDDIARERTAVLIGDILGTSGRRARQSLITILSREAGLSTCDLLEAGTLIEENRGRQALEKMALDLLTDKKNEKVESAYQALGCLPVDTVVSFHPDPALERALAQAEPAFQSLIDDSDLARLRLTPHNRQLYLLGGSAISGKGLLLTRRDYHSWIRRIRLLARGLRERLSFSTLLLLNFDLADVTLKNLYFQATRHRSSKLHPSYLVGCKSPEQWLESSRALDLSAEELLQSLVVAVPGPAVAISQQPLSPQRRVTRNPYKFLDCFEAEDRDLFFGREDDATRVAAEIRAAPGRILILCGRSGVGKTSLLKAAVMWRLETEADVIYVRSTAAPEEAIRTALTDRLNLHERASSARLQAYCRRLFLANRREQLIFIDQFEEGLIKLSEPLLRSLFAALLQCVSDRSLATRFILVVREDFLGHLAEYIGDSPELFSSVYRLGELSRDSARDAILQPPQRAGVEIRDELATAILDDLSADSIMPAHLQIICHQLYQYRAETGKLTLSDYDKLGRARKILATHLDTVLRSMPEGSEQPTRSVLRALVTSQHTKDLLTMSQITARCRLSSVELEKTVHELIHVHRLMREVPGDPVRFELSHEILADSVASWLDSQEERIRTIQEIISQEYVTSQRLGDHYHIGSDRLSLIDEYRSNLTLPSNILSFVISEFAINARLTEFWINASHNLSNAERLEAAVFRPARVSLETLEGLLGSPLDEFFSACNPMPFPESCSRMITKIVARGESTVLRHAIQLSLLDASGLAEARIVLDCLEFADTRRDEIYRLFSNYDPGSPWLPEACGRVGLRLDATLSHMLGCHDPGRLMANLRRESVASNLFVSTEADRLLKRCVGALGALRTHRYSTPGAHDNLVSALTMITFKPASQLELIRWSLLWELVQGSEAKEQVTNLIPPSLQALGTSGDKTTDKVIEMGVRETLSLWLSDISGCDLSDAEVVTAILRELSNESHLDSEREHDSIEILVATSIELLGLPAVQKFLGFEQPPWLIQRMLVALVKSKWLGLLSAGQVELAAALDQLPSPPDIISSTLQAYLRFLLLPSSSTRSVFEERLGMIIMAPGSVLQIAKKGTGDALLVSLGYWLNHLEGSIPELGSLLNLARAVAGWNTPIGVQFQYDLGKVLADRYFQDILGGRLMALRGPVSLGFLRAMRLMNRSSYEAHLPIILRCLKDGDLEVRILAARLLIDAGYEPAIQLIRKTLRDVNLATEMRTECLKMLASAPVGILTQKIAPIFLSSKISRLHFVDVLFMVTHRELAKIETFIESLLQLGDARSKEGREIVHLLKSWMPEVKPTLVLLSKNQRGRVGRLVSVVLSESEHL